MSDGERVLVTYARLMTEMRQRLRDQLDRLKRKTDPPEE